MMKVTYSDEWLQGITATEVHGYRLKQPIGFLAKHVDKPERAAKRTPVRKPTNKRKPK
jgi:hypothetical protein